MAIFIHCTVKHSICEEMNVKNITVSVDEETHRLARVRAAELGTSVSALIQGYLKTLARKRPDQTATRLGFMAGQIEVPDDFDNMGGPEIEKMFGGDA